MNLYVVSQIVNTNYDTYDSMLVAALDPETASKMHPSDSYKWQEDKDQWGYYVGDRYVADGNYSSWAKHFNQVDVELIGVAIDGTKKGVILASFNAG